MSVREPPEKLLALQRQFADHLRDPDRAGAPDGLEERRLAIYRRLFFNNLRNLFARNFPVLRRLFDDPAWDALIRDFMVRHRPSTPMFTEIGSEFVRYLAEARPTEESDPPWLTELAHWEYLETTVRLHEADPNTITVEPELRLLEGHPLINPTLALAQYHWPVHRISPTFRPTASEHAPVILAAWRRRNDRVGFMKINPLTARLITLLQEDQASGTHALDIIARELAQPRAATVAAGNKMLTSLHQQEIILGSSASNDAGTDEPPTQ